MSKIFTRGTIVGTALAVGTLVTAQAVAISYSRSQHPDLTAPAASETVTAAPTDEKVEASPVLEQSTQNGQDPQSLGGPLTSEQDDSEADDEASTSSGGNLQTLPGAGQSAAGDAEDEFEPEDSGENDD